MTSSFVAGSALPPLFDSDRATRTLEELAGLALDIVQEPDLRSLLAAAAANSPFLARAMLKESAFLPEMFRRGPASILGTLDAEALGVAALEDEAGVMRGLRVAKRRAALTVALADIAGQFDVMNVTAALTCFADACVAGALRFLLCRAAKAL